MGIDGIGKPPPISPPGGPSAPLPVGSTGREFEVGAASPAGAASGAQPSRELARLERGEIGLDAYLDGQIGQATQHLVGKMSPEQLDFVRQTLRTELASDPVLVELVRRTTGKTPETASE